MDNFSLSEADSIAMLENLGGFMAKFDDNQSIPLIDQTINRSEIVNISAEGSQCFTQEPVGFNRYLLIVGFGCPIAIFSFISNILLVRVFADRTKRNTPTLYLLVLAFLDVWISLCYIAIMGVDAFAIYHELGSLLFLWNQYLIPVFTISRIVELACPYIIIAATVERYILSTNHPMTCLLELTTNRARRCTVGLFIFMSTACRIPTLWSLEIRYAVNCTSEPLGMVTVWPTEFYFSDYYQDYDFYFMPVFQTFLPISILLVMNFGILKNLRKRYETRVKTRTPGLNLTSRARREARLTQNKNMSVEIENDCPSAANGAIKSSNTDPNNELALLQPNSTDHRQSTVGEISPFATIGINVNIFHQRKARFRQLKEDKAKVKGAAITLIAIVTSYLFCAFFSLFIRILERVQGHQLLQYSTGENTVFYTYSTDLISFFVMFNSFLRVFIYYAANKEVRLELKQLKLCPCCSLWKDDD